MEKTQNEYSLPISKSDFRVAFSDSRAHYGPLENAVDFPLPIGTEVLAARGGKVIAVKADSNEGGTSEKFSKEPNKYLNSISIEHENGEISEYAHLKYNGAKVKTGQYVDEGELIGYSGNTGLSSAPHLHFHVAKLDKNSRAGFKTLRIKFQRTDQDQYLCRRFYRRTKRVSRKFIKPTNSKQKAQRQ
ncbi:MAG: M23 family metallopeptidase [Candidatus Pacearchaeota archaeon]